LVFDLQYISRRSLTEDLRIMLRTLPVVAGRFGGW
jgi:lipopolysaccharide/colanic/teichoic acid biosynthesis glycosyltransferase